MARTPKHRFDAEEAIEAFALLTDEEQSEYNGIGLEGGISVAGNERMRTLETIAYTRLTEERQNG